MLDFLSSPNVQQIILSAALFIAMWVLLTKFLFEPFFAMLAEREARTVGDEKTALQRMDESKAVQGRIDAGLREARIEGIAIRDSQSEKAKGEAYQIISAANDLAQKNLEKARSEIEALKVKARTELGRESEKLAEAVMNRVIVSSSGPTVH